MLPVKTRILILLNKKHNWLIQTDCESKFKFWVEIPSLDFVSNFKKFLSRFSTLESIRKSKFENKNLGPYTRQFNTNLLVPHTPHGFAWQICVERTFGTDQSVELTVLCGTTVYMLNWRVKLTIVWNWRFCVELSDLCWNDLWNWRKCGIDGFVWNFRIWEM